MQSKQIVMVVATLIIGLGLGFAFGQSKDEGRNRVQIRNGSHMMADGTMMGDDEGNMNMGDMMTSMNQGLKGKTGDAFDKAFLSEMIVHHEGAVEMAKQALVNANHNEIKDLANAIIAAQNKEIGDMKSWEKSWFTK